MHALDRHKIAFILNEFPIPSQTFINQEIIGLKQLGMSIELCSLIKPQDVGFDGELKRMADETFYLLPFVSAFRLFKAHLYFLCRFPVRYLKTAFFSITHRRGAGSIFGTVAHILFSKKDLSKSQRQDLFFHFLLSCVLARVMMRKDIQLINAHFADAAASFAMLCSKLLAIPYSITAHAYDIFAPQTNLTEKFEGARFIVTCTQYNKQHLLETFPELEARVSVVYHGIDLDELKRKKQKSGRPVILSVGRLVPKKGMLVLVEACRLLKKRNVPFTCYIIGEGPERPRLEMKIKLDDLVGDVELPGAMFPDQVIAHYRRADIFVLPCIVEADGNRDGIPNVLAEAMAMEIPVISTGISAIPELITDGVDGILVDQGDAEKVCEAMISLMSSPRKKRSITRNGRLKVEKMFDRRVNLLQLRAIYQSHLLQPD
ncbi:hypothetical protein A2V82_06640 [candidate division KSB1 bacterium RBG_16_48_16]|nr:MAG: hypothetical protein A2V82_06640 [candidate division KSB1 bacterium RBG_16_48_16]